VTFFTKWLENTDWAWAKGHNPEKELKDEYMARIKSENPNSVYNDLVKRYGKDMVDDALRAPDLSTGAQVPPPF